MLFAFYSPVQHNFMVERNFKKTIIYKIPSKIIYKQYLHKNSLHILYKYNNIQIHIQNAQIPVQTPLIQKHIQKLENLPD